MRKGYAKRKARALAMNAEKKRRASLPIEPTNVAPTNNDQRGRATTMTRELASL